jgi:hypothetical protein
MSVFDDHLTDRELGAALIGMFAYDTGSVGSGIRDEALRARCLRELDQLSPRAARILLGRLARDQFLTEEALELSYGLEDVKAFTEWLDEHMGYPL